MRFKSDFKAKNIIFQFQLLIMLYWFDKGANAQKYAAY